MCCGQGVQELGCACRWCETHAVTPPYVTPGRPVVRPPKVDLPLPDSSTARQCTVHHHAVCPSPPILSPRSHTPRPASHFLYYLPILSNHQPPPRPSPKSKLPIARAVARHRSLNASSTLLAIPPRQNTVAFHPHLKPLSTLCLSPSIRPALLGPR